MILHISSEVNVDQKDEIFLARYVREVVFFCERLCVCVFERLCVFVRGCVFVCLRGCVFL